MEAEITTNLFTTSRGKKILRNLETYSKTVISYNWYERYGEERITKDLNELGYNCELYVDLDTFTPDVIKDKQSYCGKKTWILEPILPAVYISRKEE